MNPPPQPTVLVNHLGFRPDDPFKRALIPLTEGGNAGLLGARLCQVIDVGRFIQLPLNSPEGLALLNLRSAKVERSPLGDYAVCDFSELTARGGYQVQHEGARSYPFVIYRDAWKRCFRILLEWYRIAACGEAVPGYHEACHLDDCRFAGDGAQADLVGGWHDAGDLRKWTSTMAAVTWRLAQLIDEQGERLTDLGLDEALVWRQLERGARYVLKCIDPVTGLVWHSVASAGDNSCNVWTDNIPGSGDERYAERDMPLDTADWTVRCLASASRALKDRDPAFAAETLAAAKRIWNAMAQPYREAEGIGVLLPSALELARTTGEDQYRDVVTQALRELLDTQQTVPAFGQSALQGFFVEDGRIAYNGDFTYRSGRNLMVMMEKAEHLASALLLWPNDVAAPRWREGLTLLLDGCIEPMIRRSPFRVLPASLYRRGDCPLGGHDLDGELMFRYFPHEAEGANRELGDTAAALGQCARALGEPRYAALGQKQLEWILGFNPSGQSMLTGLGYSSLAVFSPYLGQITGGVINGYTSDENDAPEICLHREMEPMNQEYWSMNVSSMLRALAVLENEPLS